MMIFELAVYAQHYGVETRLLDWTKNPFVASYFACSHALKMNYDPNSKFCIWVSVHDKFHRTLILSGFCLLKIAKISLNSSFSQNQLNAESPFEHSLNHSEINSLRVVHASLFLSLFDHVAIHPLSNTNRSL